MRNVFEHRNLWDIHTGYDITAALSTQKTWPGQSSGKCLPRHAFVLHGFSSPGGWLSVVGELLCTLKTVCIASTITETQLTG
jgi:hypothetical protein